MRSVKNEPIQWKTETLTRCLDLISKDGLPEGQSTLISGKPGSAKTLMACQFLARGIEKTDQGGVLVTFEASPCKIRESMSAFGWDIRRWEKEGKWQFVDASPQPGFEASESGKYDLGALIARIEYAINKVGAKRVSLDSLETIFNQFKDMRVVLNEVFRLARLLKKLGLTVFITAEGGLSDGDKSRLRTEDFIADNIIFIQNERCDQPCFSTAQIMEYENPPSPGLSSTI